MAKIQIQIVTWDSKNHLERLFLGIKNQEYSDFEVLVIDNNSTDGTLEWLNNFSIARHGNFKIKIISNTKNKGFAMAHNQGFKECKSEYVLVLNPDTELQAGFLFELLKVIESDSSIGAVGGKSYLELPKYKKFGIIDSCGLKMLPWGEVVQIGFSCKDLGQFDHQKQVFGLTGACVLYRIKALKEVGDKNGIFDERFGSYKEDVDLSWRLNRAGWKNIYVPKAFYFHARGVSKGDRDSRSDLIKTLSTRNHLITLKKNLRLKDFWMFPFIAIYEFIKFFYIVLLERQNLKAYKINSKIFE